MDMSIIDVIVDHNNNNHNNNDNNIDEIVPRRTRLVTTSSSTFSSMGGCTLPRTSSISGLSSYSVLPQPPLRLSVLKLDGSLFQIEVMKSSTVAELRQAVEDAFSHFPINGPDKISWPHVWGHFCLSYKGQNLVSDTEYIRSYGIKDGDQLQFVRHISPNCSLLKKRTIKWITSLDRCGSLTRSSVCDEMKKKKDQKLEEPFYNIIEQDHYKVDRLCHRWFSYSSLPSTEKTKGSLCGFLDSFRIQFCGSSSYDYRDTWKD